MIIIAYMNSARQSQEILIKNIYDFQKRSYDLQEKSKHYILDNDSLTQHIHELQIDFNDMLEDFKAAQENSVTIQSFIFTLLSCGKLDRLLSDKCLDALKTVQSQVQVGKLLVKIGNDFFQVC